MAHDLIKHITCQSLRLLGHAVASLNKVRREAILKKVGLQKFNSLAAKGPSQGSGLFSEDLRDLLRERTQDARALLGASKVASESRSSNLSLHSSPQLKGWTKPKRKFQESEERNFGTGGPGRQAKKFRGNQFFRPAAPSGFSRRGGAHSRVLKNHSKAKRI